MDPNPEIKFLHYRYSGANGILSRGGVTIAYCETSPGVIRHANARCHPKDNFVKAQGRVKAAGRLLSKQAKEFKGTEQELLVAIEQDLASLNSLYSAVYGFTLDRKYNGRRKARGPVTEPIANADTNEA